MAGYVYGQIIEVRGEDGAQWERRVFVEMLNGRAVCIEGECTQSFIKEKVVVNVHGWGFHRPLSDPNAFVDGELVVNTHTYGFHRYGSGDRPDNYRRPTIEEARKLLPWCKIEAK